MGAIGGMLGTSGGVNGTGISGPKQAGIDKAATIGQANNQYGNADDALAAQQRLLSAIQGQHGLAMQSDVYNSSENLANQLARANGLKTQQGAISGLQNLSGQYQNIANGQGPNPAMAALANATGANVANQAALMAGQRGAGSNVGLVARQAAQQGAATQQQAVGQGAEMQANQQLSALGQMGGLQQSIAGLGGQQIGMQQAQQQALAGQANQMAANQMAATTGLSQGAQSLYGQNLGALGAQNSAQVASQGNVNSANASMANTSMQGQQGVVGGLMGGAGAVGKVALGVAYGGEIKNNYADGGMVNAPTGSFGQFLSGWNPGGFQGTMPSGEFINETPSSNPGAEALQKSLTGAGEKIAAGMKDKASSGPDTVQSGSNVLMAGESAPQQNMSSMAPAPQMSVGAPATSSMPVGDGFYKGGLAATGGPVDAKSPDQKAEKQGNSYDNDKIPAMLSEGEVVIPRDVMQSEDPIKAATDFVAGVIAKRGNNKPKTMFAYGGEGETAGADIGADTGANSGAQTIEAKDATETQQAAPQQATTSAPLADPQAVGLPAPTQPAAPQEIPPGLGITGDEKLKEHMQTAYDMASGAVTPMTYKQLYGKEDTLGKVGTLFGLLVGGMGSGLTHQPNVVLDMMNKEIERDVEAQQKNKDNGRNFISLNHAKNLAQAQILEHQINAARNNLTGSIEAEKFDQYLKSIGKDPTAAAALKKRAEAAWAPIDGDITTRLATIDAVKKIAPNNPTAQAVAGEFEKDQHQRALKKLKDGHEQVKTQLQTDANRPSIVDTDKLFAGRDAGRVTPEGLAYAAGAIPQADIDTIQKSELPAANENRNNFYNWDDSFRKLSDMPLAGQAPGVSAGLTAVAGGLGAYLGGPLSGVISGGVSHAAGQITQGAFENKRNTEKNILMAKFGKGKEDEIESILPSWNDTPESMEEKYRKGREFFYSNENTPVLDSYKKKIKGLKREFPNPEFKAPRAKEWSGSSGKMKDKK
jgi:hypothetical protein